MNKKRLLEPHKTVGVQVSLSRLQQAAEIQARHGDVSMSQVWRRAINIGLDQLLKDAREIKPNAESRP
jgi:hypothetical protein